MKRGQTAEGLVEKTEFGGKGIVTVEGEPVRVKGVLKGQKILLRIKKAGKGKAEGNLMKVLEPSPDETVPDCVHFGACGGCALRTLPYEKQLAMKEEQVKEILEAACPDPHFEGIYASPVILGYRNKMEFSFGDSCKDGPMTLGLHKKGSFYDIITVDQCQIVDEDFRKILTCTLNLAAESGMPYYRRNTHIGYFRHLLIRKAWRTGELLVDLVTSSQAEGSFEKEWLAGFVKQICSLSLDGKLVGVLHTVNDREADVVSSDRTEILFGQDHFHEELLGLSFEISPFSFFQNNTAGAELLYNIAREYIGDTKDREIFDLYSGTGTIAQMLAPVARHVIGVEIVEEAVEAARRNAKRNGLTNCTFIAGDVLKVLDTLPQKPDLIVLDPPREGVHPKALPRIAAYGVDRIVYISCKPTSLLQDLAVLQYAGYEVSRSCAVDMFCGTGHVETVVLLTRNTAQVLR